MTGDEGGWIWKDMRESELDTGNFVIPFQCVPDGTKEEHRAAELG
jgi:hypothetical protein